MVPNQRAHPRSRGENLSIEHWRGQGKGSSPLTRGKRCVTPFINFPVRLIPAHAGKTTPSARVNVIVKAHPRSRGENGGAREMTAAAPGSSPLTRGKLWVAGAGEPSEGLIPAHAGKTREGVQVLGKAGAHPRSRGENSHARPRPDWRRGSSPLTRGKPSLEICTLTVSRLIPAHAGKT